MVKIDKWLQYYTFFYIVLYPLYASFFCTLKCFSFLHCLKEKTLKYTSKHNTQEMQHAELNTLIKNWGTDFPWLMEILIRLFRRNHFHFKAIDLFG